MAKAMQHVSDVIGYCSCLILVTIVSGFNIDTSRPIILADPGANSKTSYFGYSVALYNYSFEGSSADTTW